MREFDDRCKQFTELMAAVTNWKQNYLGSAYSTRLKTAIGVARRACDEMETWMKDNNEW